MLCPAPHRSSATVFLPARRSWHSVLSQLGQRFKLKLAVGQMSPHALIGQMSVGQVSVDQISVDQVSVGQMGVGQMSRIHYNHTGIATTLVLHPKHLHKLPLNNTMELCITSFHPVLWISVHYTPCPPYPFCSRMSWVSRFHGTLMPESL